MAGPLVELVDVTRIHPRGTGAVVALDGVSLAIGAGDSVAITGPSGSGKSTLLALLGLLDRPSSGVRRVLGRAVDDLDDAELSRVRNRTFGFVFQSFHLIPQLSVAENVETPLLYASVPEREWRERALQALDRVRLRHRADHRPSELSGGEAQRAAIARALVNDPDLLLADEPTGNLDSRTGAEVADLLFELGSGRRAVVLVTHDESLATRAGRRVVLRDGRVDSHDA
jgi:putative ABC transport system ATP-binding protein